jgi:hypothetical protein
MRPPPHNQVAHRDDSVERPVGFEQTGVAGGVVEARGDGAVGPRVVEAMALVGGEDGLGAGARAVVATMRRRFNMPSRSPRGGPPARR